MAGILKLARAGLVLKVGTVAATGVSAVVFARLLGAEVYGQYSFLISILAVVMLPLQGGLSPLVVRETAKIRARADPSEISRLLAWARGFSAKGSLLLALAAGAAMAGLSWRGELSTGTGVAIAFLCLAIPVVALGDIRAAVIRGVGRPALGLLPELVLRPLIHVVLFVLFWLFIRDGMLFAVTAAYFVAAVIAYFIGNRILSSILPGWGSFVGKPAPDAGWYKAVAYLAAISATQVINSQLATIVLGLTHSAAAVGHLKIAIAFGGLLLVGMQAINKVASPQIASNYFEGNREGLQRILAGCALVSFALSVPILVLLLLGGEGLVVWIVGPQFKESYFLVLIIAVGQALNAFFGPAGIVLTMTGHEKQYSKAVAYSSFLGIAFSLALIPLYGAMGAAVSVAISLAVSNLLFWLSAKQVLGVDASALSIVSLWSQRRGAGKNGTGN